VYNDVEVNVMYHSLPKRFLALLIDSMIVGIILSLLKTVFGVFNDFPQGFWFVFKIGYKDWWSIFAFGLYYLYFAAKYNGITIGKASLNLVVLKDDYSELSRNDLIQRELLKALIMPISIISAIFVLFREDHKALHDLLHHTIVIVDSKNRNHFYE
jgi:uncharacterized RDD family membrane protein YckC